MRRVLLQWGQRSGRLIGDDVVVADRESIRAGAYHSVRARSRICKMGTKWEVEFGRRICKLGRRICKRWGADWRRCGRRQICKTAPVARRRVGPWSGAWLRHWLRWARGAAVWGLVEGWARGSEVVGCLLLCALCERKQFGCRLELSGDMWYVRSNQRHRYCGRFSNVICPV